MALIYKKGNILDANENIICHQVNAKGVMGGGLAKQIASRYPIVEKHYKSYCKICFHNYEYIEEKIMCVSISDNQVIANCFTQKPNFDTDYDAIKSAFKGLLIYAKDNNQTICVPYKYGCGIANGDWKKVSRIFEDLSNEFKVDIVVYQLEEE